MIYTGTYRSKSKFNAAAFPSISLQPAVVSPDLAYIDPIVVKVEGKAFDIIYSGIPTNRQVLFRKAFGVFVFDINMGIRDVFVMYQK
jgi:hypothetical protein